MVVFIFPNEPKTPGKNDLPTEHTFVGELLGPAGNATTRSTRNAMLNLLSAMIDDESYENSGCRVLGRAIGMSEGTCTSLLWKIHRREHRDILVTVHITHPNSPKKVIENNTVTGFW